MKEEDVTYLGVVVPIILVLTMGLFTMGLTRTVKTCKKEILKEIRLIDTNKIK